MQDIKILVARPARKHSLQHDSRRQTFLFSLLVLLEDDLLIDFILLLTCRHGLALELTLGDEVGGRGTGGRGGCHKDYCFRVDASGHCSRISVALKDGDVRRGGPQVPLGEILWIAKTGEKKDFCGIKRRYCIAYLPTIRRTPTPGRHLRLFWREKKKLKLLLPSQRTETSHA
jgi:hypothetical protein